MKGTLQHITNTLPSSVRPREKLKANGIRSLSDGELIQLLIGSGTVQFGVAKLSRKIARLIKESSGDVSQESLLMIPGVGPAKVAQIIASLELAARYPIAKRDNQFTSLKDAGSYLRRYPTVPDSIVILTLDISRRLIERRIASVAEHKLFIKDALSAAIHDSAQYVVCARCTDDAGLLPTMGDLAIAKDVRQLGKLLGLNSVEYLLYDAQAVFSVMKEVDHAGE